MDRSWRKLFFVLVAFCSYATPAVAQGWDDEEPSSGSTYDWRSGNRYNWRENSDGSTTVDGSNYGTGSRWRTEIEADGDMSGRDSDGNTWSYDASTGYYRSSDGTVCFGRGAARTCN